MSSAQPAVYEPEAYDENFPVASRLLQKEWRAPILSFYSFIRGMDEISDSPTLAHEQKRQQLRLIKIALKKENPELLPEWAQSYYHYVTEGKFSGQYGELLWKAFWQDTEKHRYHHFSEVIDYCKYSAAPVGRAVLEIAGEKHPNLIASDALCIALQLLNHLQDLRSDYLTRERCYLPQSWLREVGIHESVLEKKRTGPKLRRVQDRWLDETDKLLKVATRLPRSIRNRRLRWEIKIILAWAQELSRKLRRRDPLRERVKLTKLERTLAAVGGFLFL
jgi:farnesyl-diphosphate farnesyltransferase